MNEGPPVYLGSSLGPGAGCESSDDSSSSSSGTEAECHRPAQALASPARLRLLLEPLSNARTVDQLAAAV